MLTTSVEHEKLYWYQWYRSLPEWGWWVAGFGVALGLLSPHPFLSLFAWMALPVLVRLTWRTGEPPIATVGVLILWVFAIGPVLYFSGVKGLHLEEVSSTYATRFSTSELETASWLAVASVVVLAAGLRLGLLRLPAIPWKRIRTEARQLHCRKIIVAWGCVYAFNFLVGGGYLLRLGGLSQLVMALPLLQWVFFFMLAYTVLVQKRDYHLLLTAIAIEMSLGLIGYWGDFRGFFFIFAIAYVGARPQMTAREGKILVSVFLMVFTVGLFWQSVKMDYRDFLTGGEHTMSVQVSYGEQVDKMWELLKTTGWSDMGHAMDGTVERICVNTFFFGEVVEYIPAHRPYDGGAGWMRGIRHVLMPRMFFPDKPPLNDSKITNQYIGRHVTEDGASFSIGYFGESYADFGPVLMFVPIFLVGLTLGLMYRFFLVYPRIKIIGFAFATAFLPARISGLDDIPSMLGLTITKFVVMAALLHVLGYTFYRWLQRP